MMMRGLFGVCLLSVICLCGPLRTQAADLSESLKAIRQVESEGRGHKAAQQAMKFVTETASPVQLPEILAAMDGANPLAANWIRSAVEVVADKALKSNTKLPQADLEKFLAETSHDPRARRLAFEWIAKIDPTAPDRLIPGMLQDPSVELRRDAVARLMDQATKQIEQKADAEARKLYDQALAGARDEDQVEDIAKALDKLGEKVDVAQHYGFVMDWQLLGPFDNKNKLGFNVAYPPESAIDLKAKLAGREGEIGWVPHVTEDGHGIVDLSKALAHHKGAVTYAYTEFEAPKGGPVDIRLGTPNAWKLWVNGKFVFGRDEYHRGMAIDQYKQRVELKPGKNQILLKICQNEQTEEWAQRWQYQLRVCDSAGTAVLSASRPAPKTASLETTGAKP